MSKRITVSIEPEQGHAEPKGTELEYLVDEDLNSFEEFMLRQVDKSGGLSKPERAIIKTYLWWKTQVKEEDNG